MLKTNLMYYRIEGMRKEGHELVQWCLKRHVQVPSSVQLKPNLQPIELHIIRVYQSPVENSDEESNSRDHVLRSEEGGVLWKKCFHFHLKTPGELIEERK